MTAETLPAQAACAAGGRDELAQAAANCRACPELAAARSSVVVGVNPPGAEVLFVGEAPGAQEDAAGVPFVGKAGQLLDTLLAEAGLRRSQVAVVNVLKCRPPGNRKPKRDEMDRCAPWLDRQVELIDPLVICTLGGTAAEWALGRGVRINAVRAAEQTYNGRRLIPTYHPSAAIRFGPNGAPLAALRHDLATVARLVGELSRGREPRTDR
jgi:uracil-DNA glycosylase